MQSFSLFHGFELLRLAFFSIQFGIEIAFWHLVDSFHFTHHFAQVTLVEVIVSLAFQLPDFSLDPVKSVIDGFEFTIATDSILTLVVLLILLLQQCVLKVLQLQVLLLQPVIKSIAFAFSSFILLKGELVSTVALQSVKVGLLFPFIQLAIMSSILNQSLSYHLVFVMLANFTGYFL